MCVQSIVVRLISEMVPAVSTVGSCLELTTVRSEGGGEGKILESKHLDYMHSMGREL